MKRMMCYFLAQKSVCSRIDCLILQLNIGLEFLFPCKTDNFFSIFISIIRKQFETINQQLAVVFDYHADGLPTYMCACAHQLCGFNCMGWPDQTGVSVKSKCEKPIIYTGACAICDPRPKVNSCSKQNYFIEWRPRDRVNFKIWC